MAIQQDLPLITTVTVSLTVAFICGMIASKLRIPPIVGYLLAGVIIGPMTPGVVVDLHIAEELSEIGIVLLMFGVGLHFSFDDLMEVRRIALPGAIAQIAAATLMGWGLGHLLGWPLESGIMFGLALSVASTVVLLRSMEDHNLLKTTNGKIAVGWLIVEDLVMVLALVMIPAFAHKGYGPFLDQNALHLLFIAIGKVVLFVVIMLVAGRRLLPWALTVVAATRSRELFTLAVFAAAVSIAFGAAQLFGVSFALGAFFSGMMIRESDLNHEVAARALPFQDAFAVLFFVAVGMLFDPAVLVEQPLNVVAVVAIIMIGKSLAAFGIVLLFGYPLRTALIVSSGLAQIGEFSFILISLGLAYGLLPEEGRDLILAGALISIALNPAMFWLSQVTHQYVSNSPRLSSMFNVKDDDLAHLENEERAALKDTVILVGYGRVGRYIMQSIQDAHLEMVIIDSNRERVETLRENGMHAVAGDAGSIETLREAAIDKATAIVVAVPDSFEAGRIMDAARELRPDIQVLVRAHNDEEISYFKKRNANLVVTGPQQIGHRMAQYLSQLNMQKA